MPLPTIGATPQNQLDALPLLTAAQAAAPGQVQIIGNTLTRYWDPGTLGVNGILPVADANGFLYITTAFLDTRGCAAFAFLLRRQSSAGALAAQGAGTQLGFQYRFNVNETPPLSKGATQNLVACGASLISSTTVNWPAMQSANELQDAFYSIGHGQPNSLTTTAGGGIMGTDVRFFLYFPIAPVANSLFSMSVWGFQA